jgi:hypothetical protein
VPAEWRRGGALHQSGCQIWVDHSVAVVGGGALFLAGEMRMWYGGEDSSNV